MKNILFFSLLFCFGPIRAMHILGGYMTYQCEAMPSLNAVKVRVQMTVYRDCLGGGAPFDNPAQLAVYKAGVLHQTLVVNQIVISPVIINSPICGWQPNFLCIEKGVYSTSFIVADTNTLTYTVVYQRCCRTVTYSNLLNPGDQGHTLAVDVTPAALQAINKAPQWPEPQFVTCAHIPAQIDLSADESEGDSIVYRFTSPMQGGGPLLSPQSVLYSCIGATPTPPCPPPFDSVTFAPGYTPGLPLGPSGSSNLHNVTGLWTFTPSILGHFSYGVIAEEYRNGQLLSRTLHDLSLHVLSNITATVPVGENIDLRIAPNPAEDVLHLMLDGWSGSVKICILDMQGWRWFQDERSFESGSIDLQTGALPKGLFLVQVSSGTWTATRFFLR